MNPFRAFLAETPGRKAELEAWYAANRAKVDVWHSVTPGVSVAAEPPGSTVGEPPEVAGSQWDDEPPDRDVGVSALETGDPDGRPFAGAEGVNA